jgi:uncharacterized protein (TIGR02996 family)
MYPEEATFLRTLQADPWSEGQRLIYADWLEEQGCADKAEFLRVEHTLGTMDISSPDYFRQEVRYKILREELPSAWLKAVQVPYALVLEEPLPPGRSAVAILCAALRLDHYSVERLIRDPPCILADNLPRPEGELRLETLYFDRNGGSRPSQAVPRVALRPLSSLRFALRLEQAPSRRGNKNLKLVQELTGLGFKKAVALLASVPCVVKYDLNRPDVEKWHTRFTSLGCQATYRLQPRPASQTLCRVVLQRLEPRFRPLLEERLLPICPDLRRVSYYFSDNLPAPNDPLRSLPLVLKKCVWQEEAETIQQRLEMVVGGEKVVEVSVEAF